MLAKHKDSIPDFSRDTMFPRQPAQPTSAWASLHVPMTTSPHEQTLKPITPTNMPPKRRTTMPRTASAQRQQSTLSFAGKGSRITKPTSPRSAKSKEDPNLVQEVVKAEAVANTEDQADPEEDDEDEQPQSAVTSLDEVADPLEESGGDVKTEEVLGGRAQQSELGAIGGVGAGWVGDEESEARKISQTQINKYWRAKEQERKAPRVHQQDLGVHEKILREWDMSGQYGPCIGITRLKRWKRANLLGLNPPVEVLAVLLKEIDNGDIRSQKAHVDELMNSRFVEA